MKGVHLTVSTSGGFLTVQEAMAFLRLSRSALYGLLERGQIASAKFGKARRIPREALEEYARRNTTPAR